jgi:hypothetical protein
MLIFQLWRMPYIAAVFIVLKSYGQVFIYDHLPKQ